MSLPGVRTSSVALVSSTASAAAAASNGARRVSTYQQLFGKVLNKRLKYVNNVAGILAFVMSVMLSLPYGNFWFNMLMTFTIRGPLIFLALFVVKLLRSRTIKVNHSTQKTLGSQIYYSVVSKKFVTTVLGYGVSALILSIIFIFQLPLLDKYYVVSKEYEQRPKVNDEWVYYWVYPVLLTVFYSGQQLVFERNRLNFTYGVSKIEPKQALISKLPAILSNSILINGVICTISPVIYYLVRGIIYKLNILIIMIAGLDTQLPRFHLSLGTLFHLGYLSFNIILCWELINHIFNVYATIGCLDGKKPISTYSSDPINILLSGLRNTDPENELSRLTAFQELAYIATLKTKEGAKLRSAIYNAHSKGGFLWTAILDECSLLIKETYQRINYRSSSDLKIIKSNQVLTKIDSNKSFANDNTDIFGNSFISSPEKTKASSDLKSYDEINSKKTQKEASNNQDKYLQLMNQHIFTPLENFLQSLVTPPNPKASDNYLFGQLRSLVKSALDLYQTYKVHFLSTNVGIFFRISLKRDTESRVLNPVNYGNAVIAITNLLIHSIEEDRNLTITNNHISEILNLLERPIRACNNYINNIPPSVFLTIEQKKNDAKYSKHLITLLHDLTLYQFKQVCVTYNYKLGDLLLSSTCFKLAKRVIDEEIAQRLKQ